MYTNRFGVYMAGKLYWRIKKDGKWTWQSAVVDRYWDDDEQGGRWVNRIVEEEEE